ncbi:TetR/AcrR family transcriptional regulator [Myceligenerans indicum]|uniref:TetR/AcrR family transcriptional regulator n=1 Tax=Myceligenerans indicum TaxID=2593663 RepID=A0ABS1LMC6_9MICO|nr:TetR/AcrR family transcriptional regulator [Myceligenerans indicum]MBL0887411.1 TetR/AcrR family transcriptional regulator [Myceligenerans indicum]
MEDVTVPWPDRRKARTRAALVSAGQLLLARGRTDVSIQEITDLAGVGFGSFYNHFATKGDLFEAAVEAALNTWGTLRDEAVHGLTDPAEIFAVSFRMTGRMQRRYPELVAVVLRTGTAVLSKDQGLRPRALADIAEGIAQERFRGPSPELALMVAGGALLGLLQMLASDASLDDGPLSDEFAARVLVMLGLEEREAREIVGRPLPPSPSLLGEDGGVTLDSPPSLSQA